MDKNKIERKELIKHIATLLCVATGTAIGLSIFLLSANKLLTILFA
jgi:hypothetical protein